MDQGVKIAAASSVLVIGVVTALLFRHQSPHSGPPVPGAGDQLVLRRQAAAPWGNPAADQPLTTGAGAADALSGGLSPESRPATILRPMEPGEPPPDLAKDYPSSGKLATPRWCSPAGLLLPDEGPPQESPRTHQIVDGDTLSGLAQQYLGSADRAGEIFAANRDVLSSPQILPIGTVLKIPPRGSQAPPAPGPAASRPLVPIVRGLDEEH
jgi:nucleoid-associated protein YgaU